MEFTVTICHHSSARRNGSNACTVIACHVAHSLLNGSLPTTPGCHMLPDTVISGFMDSMHAGNALYDEAGLGGQLLAVYDAVDLLHSRLVIAPRGDIGCRTEQALVEELKRLSKVADDECRLIAAVLVQTPLTVSLVLIPDAFIMIFDSHMHGAHGALIATAHLNDASSTAVGAFLRNLVGHIADCHLCVMAL